MAFREGLLSEVSPDTAIRLRFTLAFFVLYHATLFVEFFLCYRTQQMTHAVRFHPQCHIQRRRRHILEVVGTVIVGGAVHFGGAGTLKRSEVFVIVVFGTIKHQVLK